MMASLSKLVNMPSKVGAIISSMLRIRRQISDFVWKSKPSPSSNHSTFGEDSGIELGLVGDSSSDEKSIDDLNFLRQEYKDVAACHLCQDAREIIVEQLCRVHPNSLRPLQSIIETRNCFGGDKSRNYKFQHDHMQDILNNWIKRPHNTIGDLINKIKELRRRDILQDTELINLIGVLFKIYVLISRLCSVPYYYPTCHA